MITAEFLEGLSRFSLVVRKRVTSNYIGGRKSIAVGRGVTFKDYRIYAPGDDFRLIDWKVYARTDDLYVKTYEEDRNLVAHIILDVSKSMDYGKRTKFDFGAMLGVGFAYLAMKENNKFQFSTFSEEIETFHARKGLGQLAQIMQYLNKTQTKGKSNLLDSITQYKKLISGRSLVVLISDFLVPIEEIKEALRTLGKHEVKVIQVLDPTEKNLSVDGDLKLRDSETHSILRTFITRRLRQKYKHELEEHSAEIEKTCDKLGYDFYLLTTDTPIFDAFYRVLQ